MIEYLAPVGVEPLRFGGRPLLSSPKGGRIALDATLMSLWHDAQGRNLNDLVTHFHSPYGSPAVTCAALACLAEAGLLVREGMGKESRDFQPIVGKLVSVIIVSHNSRRWLQGCLPSIFAQTFAPLEVIVIDNGSSDDSADWLKANYPSIQLVGLTESQSFAYSINQGIGRASGSYLLILNPDVQLEPDAIAEMVAVAQGDPKCAAVAAKLKFSWAPAFLNGMGNRVGAFSWGTDNALGYLDLGQFDLWQQAPSACFAAALIPRTAWEAVGLADQGFPLYYEDSEWSYRARLLGYTVRVAPKAVVYHAFSGRVPYGGEDNLSPDKLYKVIYGRLRFATKILSSSSLAHFFSNYLIEDVLRLGRYLIIGRNWQSARSYLRAWADFTKELPILVHDRRLLQRRRILSDAELLALQRDLTAPLIWNGLPELTWDIVYSYYLPLFLDGKTRAIPEFDDNSGVRVDRMQGGIKKFGFLRRGFYVWRAQGISVLFHRLLRYAQWHLARA